MKLKRQTYFGSTLIELLAVMAIFAGSGQGKGKSQPKLLLGQFGDGRAGWFKYEYVVTNIFGKPSDPSNSDINWTQDGSIAF
ncbi:prepilin-type N-terminal cleavage/methylation domain-containing protein [Pedosphaera parvula]|nr:prepilin-type N-terminal cleavage/methylation domain-containing protein [Pedosphaera parvula]